MEKITLAKQKGTPNEALKQTYEPCFYLENSMENCKFLQSNLKMIMKFMLQGHSKKISIDNERNFEKPLLTNLVIYFLQFL